jgi:hypothetical protein
MDDLQRQIRYALRRFLDDATSFEAFEDWFVDATWDVGSDHPDLGDLAYEIEGHLSDFTSGRISESQLKRCLRPLAPANWDAVDATLAIPAPPKSSPTSSAKPRAKVGSSVVVLAAGT